MAIAVHDDEVTAADLTASRRLAVDAELQLLPVDNAHADDEVNADELRLFPHPTTMARLPLLLVAVAVVPQSGRIETRRPPLRWRQQWP